MLVGAECWASAPTQQCLWCEHGGHSFRAWGRQRSSASHLSRRPWGQRWGPLRWLMIQAVLLAMAAPWCCGFGRSFPPPRGMLWLTAVTAWGSQGAVGKEAASALQVSAVEAPSPCALGQHLLHGEVGALFLGCAGGLGNEAWLVPQHVPGHCLRYVPVQADSLRAFCFTAAQAPQ